MAMAGVTLWVAAFGCSGQVQPRTPCSGAPASGGPCGVRGAVCPFTGSSGCICDSTGIWSCPPPTSPAGSACTEQTFGMPCDPGGGACSGLCLPESTSPESSMLCVPATPFAIDRVGLSTLDGINCSPQGVPGSDCQHACVGGRCTLADASSGSACALAAGRSVCEGACDGEGACKAVALPCTRAGFSECSYGWCGPADSRLGCQAFAAPAGEACSGDPCLTCATCDGTGNCTGGMPVTGCSLPGVDAGP